jgi:3-oxoacyl-[acyl-carrier protein] reductase
MPLRTAPAKDLQDTTTVPTPPHCVTASILATHCRDCTCRDLIDDMIRDSARPVAQMTNPPKTSPRTVLITGATRGIGRAIALHLAEQGHRVVLNYHGSDSDGAAALAACLDKGGSAVLVKSDISNRAGAESFVHAATRAFGAPDILINNAGLNIDRPFLSLTDDDWDRVVNTNMKAVFLCTQAAAPLMLRGTGDKLILNLSATTAIRGRANGLNYCASKAAVLTMTKCLALELAPKIRVNCVIPGLVETEEAHQRFKLGIAAERLRLEQQIPLGYIGSTQDVAEVVAFLMSPGARYVSGQKFIIDGGEYMY